MNCPICIYRRHVPGDAHSSCAHPSIEDNGGPLIELLSLLQVFPVSNDTAAAKLGVTINQHGFEHGWANWPYNFDPVWIDSCNGFTSKDAPQTETPQGG